MRQQGEVIVIQNLFMAMLSHCSAQLPRRLWRHPFFHKEGDGATHRAGVTLTLGRRR